MTQINVYLTFDGNCREAMNFYKECLGGDLHLMTVGGSPAEAHCAPEMKDYIMHATLTNGGLVLMASDNIGPRKFLLGNDMSLSLNCSSEEEINTFWVKLSEGGEIQQPLQVMFWGATFGMFKDRFGKRWMLNYDKPTK